jgi:hypothetical protein
MRIKVVFLLKIYIERKDNKSSYEMYNELKNIGYSIEELTEFFNDFDQDGNPIKIRNYAKKVYQKNY